MAMTRRGALSPGLRRTAPAAFSGEAARNGGACFAEAEQGDDFGIDVHRERVSGGGRFAILAFRAACVSREWAMRSLGRTTASSGCVWRSAMPA